MSEEQIKIDDSAKALLDEKDALIDELNAHIAEIETQNTELKASLLASALTDKKTDSKTEKKVDVITYKGKKYSVGLQAFHLLGFGKVTAEQLSVSAEIIDAILAQNGQNILKEIK